MFFETPCRNIFSLTNVFHCAESLLMSMLSSLLIYSQSATIFFASRTQYLTSHKNATTEEKLEKYFFNWNLSLSLNETKMFSPGLFFYLVYIAPWVNSYSETKKLIDSLRDERWIHLQQVPGTKISSFIISGSVW